MTFSGAPWTYDFNNISVDDDGSDIEGSISMDSLYKLESDQLEIPSSNIKMEKYIKQLETVHLFDVNPSSIIFSSQADMLNIIRNFSKQQQDACRDIRRKGRNKVHALKCRQKSKDELTMLQEQVKAMKQEKERQMRRKEEEEKKLLALKGSYESQLLMLEIDCFNKDFLSNNGW